MSNRLTGDSLQVLRAYIEHDRRRKAAERKGVSEALKSAKVPIPDELLARLRRMFPPDAFSVLRLHPGFRFEQKLLSVKSTLALFDKTLSDLGTALDKYQSLCSDPGFFHRANRENAVAAELAVAKEVFAFASAAQAIVNHARRLDGCISVPGYKERVTRGFATQGDHCFIIKLRNFQSHEIWLEPNWLIKSVGRSQRSHFVFEPEELLRHKWSTTARRFIQAATGTLDVHDIFFSYGQRVRKFHDWWLNQIERLLPSEVADYRRCHRAIKADSARMTYRLLIRTFIDNKVDPYEHLEKYLAPHELCEAQRLPLRSKQQVDKIIEFVDEEQACDAELRALVYKLFDVT